MFRSVSCRCTTRTVPSAPWAIARAQDLLRTRPLTYVQHSTVFPLLFEPAGKGISTLCPRVNKNDPQGKIKGLAHDGMVSLAASYVYESNANR